MRLIGRFDSASTLVRVVAAALESPRTVGLALSPTFRLAARASGLVPRSLRPELYARGAAREALRTEDLSGEFGTAAGTYFTDLYRRTQRVPALFIGAPIGALADLAAALGAAFLPQTFLVLARTPLRDPDDISTLIETSAALGHRLSLCFPQAIAHQMHDPQNDRLTVRRAAYLRMKWRRLPEPYRRFISDRLEPGGTIFVADCRYRWPVMRISERHFFQLGGHGGIAPGGLLQRYGYDPAKWEPAPEAEWGYDDALTADLVELAAARKLKIVRIAFDHPQHLSGAVARLFREDIARAGQDRLLVTNFNMMAPAHVVATGAVPYWATFNDVSSLERLCQFLESEEPFGTIDALLFQNGVPSEGQATARQWQEALQRHSRHARLVGVRMEQHPFDFAAFDRYRRVLCRIEEQQRPPRPQPRLQADAVADRLSTGRVSLERIA